MLRVLIAGTLATAIGVASADDPPTPSKADLRGAREASRAAIDAANRSPPTPIADALKAGAVAAGAQPAAPRPPLETGGGAAADIRALMARARAGKQLDTKTPPSTAPRPLVFVSLSMPEPSLQALLEQSRPVGATLVLRGLVDDSMQRTAERLGAALGLDTDSARRDRPSPDVSLMIDPTLFERFEVDAVPAFVLPLEAPAPCTAGGACPTPAHSKLAGDVALPYALELMAREASQPAVRSAAAQLAERARAPR